MKYEPIIVNGIMPRKAEPSDFLELAKRSKEVALNRDRIDWDHSWVGVKDGKIVWAYVFSTNREIPEEMSDWDNEGEELLAVELIDMVASTNIEGSEQSLARNLWAYGGGCYDRWFYYWHKHTTAVTDINRYKFYYKMVYRVNLIADKNETFWTGSVNFDEESMWDIHKRLFN